MLCQLSYASGYKAICGAALSAVARTTTKRYHKAGWLSYEVDLCADRDDAAFIAHI